MVLENRAQRLVS